MRERTSRPSWSVPSGWALEGALRIFFTSGRFGARGEMAGARSASTARQTTTTPPASASRFRRNARQKAFTRSPAPPAWGHSDPRIDQTVREVGDQVGAQGERRHDDEVAHDHGVVALEDRLDHQLPHARDGEDRLDDHAAADQARQREPEDRHDREQRVAQRVLADHHALGETLGPRGLDVVLPHDLEHRLSHVARKPGEPAEGRDQDRQDEMARRSPIFCSTGRASGENDRPKSSRTSRVSQFTYWTWRGLSSPYIWRSRSRTSRSDWTGVSPVPRSVGSPGARWITKNEMSVIPMRRGTARTSRRSAYPSMARYSSASGTRLHLPRRVALQLLWDVPLVEIVPDAVR